MMVHLTRLRNTEDDMGYAQSLITHDPRTADDRSLQRLVSTLPEEERPDYIEAIALNRMLRQLNDSPQAQAMEALLLLQNDVDSIPGRVKLVRGFLAEDEKYRINFIASILHLLLVDPYLQDAIEDEEIQRVYLSEMEKFYRRSYTEVEQMHMAMVLLDALDLYATERIPNRVHRIKHFLLENIESELKPGKSSLGEDSKNPYWAHRNMFGKRLAQHVRDSVLEDVLGHVARERVGEMRNLLGIAAGVSRLSLIVTSEDLLAKLEDRFANLSGLGEIYAESNHLEHEALDSVPEESELGQVLKASAEGNTAEAERGFLRLLEEGDRKDPSLPFRFASFLADREDLFGAETYYHMALERDPNHLPSLVALGQLLAGPLRQPDQSKKYLRLAQEVAAKEDKDINPKPGTLLRRCLEGTNVQCYLAVGALFPPVGPEGFVEDLLFVSDDDSSDDSYTSGDDSDGEELDLEDDEVKAFLDDLFDLESSGRRK
jgi:tetratricopeptide (TPR) repeat protein